MGVMLLCPHNFDLVLCGTREKKLYVLKLYKQYFLSNKEITSKLSEQQKWVSLETIEMLVKSMTTGSSHVKLSIHCSHDAFKIYSHYYRYILSAKRVDKSRLGQTNFLVL